MKNIILIVLSAIQLVALLGLIAILPSLYRREARRQEGKS